MRFNVAAISNRSARLHLRSWANPIQFIGLNCRIWRTAAALYYCLVVAGDAGLSLAGCCLKISAAKSVLARRLALVVETYLVLHLTQSEFLFMCLASLVA